MLECVYELSQNSRMPSSKRAEKHIRLQHKFLGRSCVNMFSRI